MPLFQYQGRSLEGKPVSAQIEANSPEQVANQLINRQITPIKIEEVAPQLDLMAEINVRLGLNQPTLDELILFCRQMYTLIKAGVPIIRGIVGLIETTRNEVLADILQQVRRELESGRDLSGSMANHPKVFSSLMVSMIRIGENTGNLDTAFLRLSEYLELDRDTRNRVKAALRYPSFVIIAITIALFIVNIFVIPAFAGVFEGMKMELPWQTKALISTSAFFVNYWQEMTVSIAVLFFWTRYYMNTEEGQYRWDRLKLRLPVVGSIINRATLSRFARTFSMTSRSGVPLVQGLSVVARAVDNAYIADKINEMRGGIERGDSLTRTAVATGMFTPLIIQMLSVGEETGAIDDMLEEVAGFYEREVDYDLKNISSAIEPILIIGVGILVLILALGIFLPMWEMTSMASR